MYIYRSRQRFTSCDIVRKCRKVHPRQSLSPPGGEGNCDVTCSTGSLSFVGGSTRPQAEWRNTDVCLCDQWSRANLTHIPPPLLSILTWGCVYSNHVSLVFTKLTFFQIKLLCYCRTPAAVLLYLCDHCESNAIKVVLNSHREYFL